MAQSINTGGAVTGYYHESNNVQHGFVRRADGKLISFDPPESTNTVAVSINANGFAAVAASAAAVVFGCR
jgi:hypothetical protein